MLIHSSYLEVDAIAYKIFTGESSIDLCCVNYQNWTNIKQFAWPEYITNLNLNVSHNKLNHLDI